MFKTKQEKYVETEDAIRQELGCYINIDAIKDATLMSVERVNIASGVETERTLLTYFNHAEKYDAEYELVISRADHKDLVTKLNRIKSNEK